MKANPPTLYSYTKCPFAMRARMALIHAGIECEIREVDLQHKPEDLLRYSPKGTVPVLVLGNGTVLEESLDIMNYALQQKENDKWLGGDDSMILVHQADEYFSRALERYKSPSFYGEEDWRDEAEHILSSIETALYQHSGSIDRCGHFTIKDAALLPLVYQMSMWDAKWFNGLPFIKTKTWLNRFVNSKLFTLTMTTHKVWHEGVSKEWLINQTNAA